MPASEGRTLSLRRSDEYTRLIRDTAKAIISRTTIVEQTCA